MIDSGVSLIVSDNINTIASEFTEVFNDILDVNEHTLHTFYLVKVSHNVTNNTLSGSDSAKNVSYFIDMEQIQLHIYPNTSIIYHYASLLRLSVENDFKLIDAEFVPETYIFYDNMFSKTDVIVNLKSVCTNEGNVFDVYTLTHDECYYGALNILNRDEYVTPLLNIEENDFFDLIEASVNIQIDKWEYEIESAITKDEPYPGIDENPFADRFYDRDDAYNY